MAFVVLETQSAAKYRCNGVILFGFSEEASKDFRMIMRLFLLVGVMFQFCVFADRVISNMRSLSFHRKVLQALESVLIKDCTHLCENILNTLTAVTTMTQWYTIGIT
uniref:Uncharacterized protein n=1 Tax=Glossina brevipalpis TaxID=37001 RepID=A0A1A9W5F4_9MUSC